jgi:hypothetical protein
LNGTGPATAPVCAEHPDTPATGQCVTCKKLVCDACGGVVNNRGVYCVDHTPVVTTAMRGSPGMNPLLAGAGAEAAALGLPAAPKPASNFGLILGLGGLLALILVVVALLVWPGFLASKPVTPAAPTMGSTAGAMPGASPYGTGGMAGPYGAGPQDPYSTGGFPGPGGAMPGPGAAMPGPGAAMPGPGMPPESDR